MVNKKYYTTKMTISQYAFEKIFCNEKMLLNRTYIPTGRTK